MRYVLHFVLAVVGCYTMADADNMVVVDDSDIMEKIYADIPVAVVQSEGCGLHSLLGNISEKFPESLKNSVLNIESRQVYEPEEIYNRLCISTLVFGNYYDCGSCDNMHMSVGATAYSLSEDGICATSYHVMEDIIEKDMEALEGDSLYYVSDMKGRVYPVTKVLAWSKENDAAIFQVDTRGDKMVPLPLGTYTPTGSRIYVTAHPRGVLYVFTEGMVTRNRRSDQGHISCGRMEISAEFAFGSSGGPVVDRCCNLVGMVANTVGLYADQENKRDQQMVIRTAIPVEEIKKLIGL